MKLAANADVRSRVAEYGLHYNQIARGMGVRADYLCKVMRLPITDNMRQRILTAIDELSKEGDKE